MRDRDAPTWLRVSYSDDGTISHLCINWRGEQIEVVPEHGNGPTREMQRADEIVQALINQQSYLAKVADNTLSTPAATNPRASIITD